MAQAVTDLFPNAKWAIGPPVENGFYYDFDVERPFTPEDLERIEARMQELMKERQSFVREELSKEDALALFADQPYKREVIERVSEGGADQDAAVAEGEEPVFTVYRNVRPEGEEAWVDLCRGPHIPAPSASPRSSCCAPRVPTGAAARTSRCSSASTAPRGSRRRRWTPT